MTTLARTSTQGETGVGKELAKVGGLSSSEFLLLSGLSPLSLLPWVHMGDSPQKIPSLGFP